MNTMTNAGRPLWPALLALATMLALAVPAAAQTGREGGDYREPDSQSAQQEESDGGNDAAADPYVTILPVICWDEVYDGDLRYRMWVTFDGWWYYLSGSIANLGEESVTLRYPHPGDERYFFVQTGRTVIWDSRDQGVFPQVNVTTVLEPGEELFESANWDGGNDASYVTDTNQVYIEFEQNHYGGHGFVVACRDVPLLPPGTNWLPRVYVPNVYPEDWECETVDALIDGDYLPGYPPEYFTSAPRGGRELAMAAALLGRVLDAGLVRDEDVDAVLDILRATGV